MLNAISSNPAYTSNQTASLKNIYAPSATTKSSSKKDDSATIDTVYAPSAAEKYAHTDNSAITAESIYDILAERAKTSAEKLAEHDFSDMYVKSTAHQYRLSDLQRNIIRNNGFEAYADIQRQLSTKVEEATIGAGYICVPIGAGEL